MKDRVEAYRRDVRSGVNPFDGAFPLWRNEQFVAAVVDAFEATPSDPSRLATFAETERLVLLEAQRRELRLLNQRDARERGEDAEAERATCTAIAPTNAARGFTSENDALAAGLGEDDGEEVEVEGDVAVEEGLRLRDDAEDEDEDERATRTAKAETSGGDETKEQARVV